MERFAQESIWREGGVLASSIRFSYYVTLSPFLSNWIPEGQEVLLILHQVPSFTLDPRSFTCLLTASR